MSRGSRLALLTLTAVLILAPAVALHPAATHLYAAGLANLGIELSHPQVFGFFALALMSSLPAAGFLASLTRTACGIGSLRALSQNSHDACLDDIHYRLLPSDAVLVFTAGLVRPTIFVSAGAQRSLTRAELRAALLHEQAHQRGEDIIWRLLLRGVGGALAFAPRIGEVVEAEILRTECEADEYAIRGGARRRDLFEAIVATATPPCSLFVAGLTGANLELRLMRLVEPGIPLPGRPIRSFVVLTAAVALPAAVGHVIAIAAAAGTSHLMV